MRFGFNSLPTWVNVSVSQIVSDLLISGSLTVISIIRRAKPRRVVFRSSSRFKFFPNLGQHLVAKKLDAHEERLMRHAVDAHLQDCASDRAACGGREGGRRSRRGRQRTPSLARGQPRVQMENASAGQSPRNQSRTSAAHVRDRPPLPRGRFLRQNRARACLESSTRRRAVRVSSS